MVKCQSATVKHAKRESPLPPPPPRIKHRYASLFFVACIDQDDNELITLEKIHLFVEVLDRYFGNVCELDIIFNFHKAYYILDELFIGGELQVPSGGSMSVFCRVRVALLCELDTTQNVVIVLVFYLPYCVRTSALICP